LSVIRLTPEDAPSMLKQIIEEAQYKLTAISAEQGVYQHPAASLINPAGDCHWVHTGDSRIYHLWQQVAYRTIGSPVQTLVDKGEITDEGGQRGPQSNILMGCTEEAPSASTSFSTIS
jgi:serine/threonine protein phosphatase PrpC